MTGLKHFELSADMTVLAEILPPPMLRRIDFDVERHSWCFLYDNGSRFDTCDRLEAHTLANKLFPAGPPSNKYGAYITEDVTNREGYW